MVYCPEDNEYNSVPKTCPVCEKATRKKADLDEVNIKSLPRIARPKTMFEVCNVSLCVYRNRNCFKRFHTELDY